MSVTRSQSIDELLRLIREALVVLKQERAFDVDAFSDAFRAHFEQLASNPPLEEDDPDLELYRSKLKELDRLRRQLSARLGEDRGEMLDKLGRMARGRRGLDGYRAALKGESRGPRRGQG